VSPVAFTNFASGAGPSAPNGHHMILDIPGASSPWNWVARAIPNQHILQLRRVGVELDALAGEPNDVLVNGYLIAPGRGRWW